ncbi:Undecaprenyl diphosphate synthase [Olavius algarvensis spirochete endosymbiont]|uniref:polyprenyl diphosphate synthase n=1 Tax=Olavius algarvensis spirochete endosymbiont TaxID=260710 RepID=UPI00052DAC35|nr:polyprenyl diphosphate synthase [Olavius algarvensis spirochete endosymbiont]KGM42661.1 UDP diphosphate synthase [Alkalispirochaeta odontotermitis]CAD7842472.1 MAG: Undecaprenyl diphosphate synthase (EC 2.5.1.31) [Olavius algarvensis spirochete endosymbiont]VDB00379.1 Undecaprenyl diphosphate synthase [Olavius algarvensis spirochete endosymbiont]
MPSDKQLLPKHVGIIMDGNGRWAQKQGLPRTNGHKEGLETAKKIVAHTSDLGISYLSLFTFSTENWRRAEEEVNFLLELIKKHLRKQYDFYRERNIRVIHSGDLEKLPLIVREEILLVESDTELFDGMIVNLLINYGGRDEIVRSVKEFISNGGDAGTLSEESINSNLDHPELPELDLLIRTGGEIRLSNFLIWQAAYAELYFSDTYWPDWTAEDLDEAILSYQERQRRFGGTVQ